MENKIYIKNLFGDWKETNNKEEIDAHIRKHSIMENIDSVEEMLHYLKTLFVSIPAPFEPPVRILRATLPVLRASIPVIRNHHSGCLES